MLLSRRRTMALLAAALLSAGAAQAQNVTFPTGRLEIVTPSGQRHAFVVEVASTREQLSQGLMYRRTMAANAGMLFDFGRVQAAGMWMKNTFIPLDMLFVAADGRIAGIAERTVPGSLEVIESPGAIRAVIELNGGTASRLGLKAGDRVVHPPLFP